jgi:hypothetical protein
MYHKRHYSTNQNKEIVMGKCEETLKTIENPYTVMSDIFILA